MRNITPAVVAAATLVVASACVSSTSVPQPVVPSGVSATMLRLTATPSSVPQDGATPSKILIESFDAAGAPKSGVSVQLFLSGQGTLSTASAASGSDGKAS